MNILIVTHHYPPHLGGLEIVAKHQADGLATRGFGVSVLTTSSSGVAEGVTEEGQVTVYRTWASDFFERTLRIPFPIVGTSMLWRAWRLVGSADVVHLHDVFYMPSWIAALCAVLRRRPLYVTQHVALVMHPSRLVMGVQKLVYACIGDAIFRRASRLFVFNDLVRDMLLMRGVPPERVVQSRNGIDVAQFAIAREDKTALRKKYGLPLDRPIALFVGRLVPKKGYDAVCRIAGAEVDVVLVGPGTLEAPWSTHPHIFHLGSRPNHELPDIYHLADVFVFPAVGEVYTIAMQEAMAAGLPVVTTDDLGYKNTDLSRDMVVFCIPQPEILLREVIAIVRDCVRMKEMSAYSRAYAMEHFHRDAHVSLLADAYAGHHKDVVVTTSWDDGHTKDVELSHILDEYGLKGTFYIAPKNQEFDARTLLSDAEVKELSTRHEIGGHTMTHRLLPQLADEEARGEITAVKQYLETLIGKPVISFCYPRGMYEERHVKMVKEAGYRIGRTVDTFATDMGTDKLELPTTVHVYDHWSDVISIARFATWNPFLFFRYYRHFDVLAIALFDHVCRTGGVFHLWGHSWEYLAQGNEERLRRVLAHVSRRPGVRYVTNGEL